ncbi:MAG TPA: hypothetical protein VI612_01750 [Candidatus Nanoarchaeia archaeon]|nr:hypothetical protein [Candidatus Nanoarchaeia archaeon]
MVSVHLGPQWFFGVDASLEAFAAIIAFFIAASALKVFRMSHDKRYFYFMGSFALLTLSFLSRAIADILVEGIAITIPPDYLSRIFFYGYVAHIFLALAAYVILFAVTHKIHDRRIVAFLFLTLVPGLLLSASYFLSFYVISALFLAFISSVYFQNACNVKKLTPWLVFSGFMILTISQLFFLLDAVTKTQGYVLAHMTQGLGYLVLLAALLRIIFK